jgi:opacity protein-like surface antigen
MKKSLLAVAAVAVMSSTGAMAQNVPAGTYVGVGGDWIQPAEKSAKNTGGIDLRAGYNFNQYVGTELNMNAVFTNGNQRSGTDTALNVVVGAPVSLGAINFKPYALVGTGYQFSYAAHNNNIRTTPVYNVGAGVEYDLSKNIALDVRYTYEDGYNDRSTTSNSLGAVVSYKF